MKIIPNDNFNHGQAYDMVNDNFKDVIANLLKQQDSSLIFQGFAKPTDVTPAATVNHAYYVIESGTVFGVEASEGQVLVGDGDGFEVRSIEEKAGNDEFFDIAIRIKQKEVHSENYAYINQLTGAIGFSSLSKFKFVAVEKNEIVVFKCYVATENAALSFSSNLNDVIPLVAGHGADVQHEYSCVVPEDGFIVLNWLGSKPATLFIINDKEKVYFTTRGINTTTGEETKTDIRLSSNFLRSKNINITVNQGYLIAAVNYYDENYNFISGALLNTETIQLSKNHAYYRFSIKKADDGNIKLSDEYNVAIEEIESEVATDTIRINLEPGSLAGSYNGVIETLWMNDSRAFRRLCTPNYMKLSSHLNSELYVSAPGGYDYSIFYYTKDKNLISTTGWQNANKQFVPALTEFVKVIAKKSDDSIIVDEIFIELTLSKFKNDNIFSLNDKKGTYPLLQEGYINIAHPISISNPNSTEEMGVAVQDNDVTIYKNYGLLRLPSTYSEDGEPTPLIVFCHGYSGKYTYNSSVIASTSNLDVDYLLKEGYAVLDMDGSLINTSKAHGCSDMAIEAYIDGYEYVKKRYNISDNVFMSGHSQGGMMGLLLSNIGNAIPCRATCVFAPAVSVIHLMQLHPEDRDELSDYYGFQGTKPAWGSSTTFTEAERAYIYANFDKVMKSATIWSNVINLDFGQVETFNSNFKENPTTAEDEYYSNIGKICNVPTKIIHGTADASCRVGWSQNLYKMLKNTGANIELRLMNNVPHTGVNGIVAVGDNAIVTKYGESLTGVSTGLIEMVKFFRRY